MNFEEAYKLELICSRSRTDQYSYADELCPLIINAGYKQHLFTEFGILFDKKTLEDNGGDYFTKSLDDQVSFLLPKGIYRDERTIHLVVDKREAKKVKRAIGYDEGVFEVLLGVVGFGFLAYLVTKDHTFGDAGLDYTVRTTAMFLATLLSFKTFYRSKEKFTQQAFRKLKPYLENANVGARKCDPDVIKEAIAL